MRTAPTRLIAPVIIALIAACAASDAMAQIKFESPSLGRITIPTPTVPGPTVRGGYAQAGRDLSPLVRSKLADVGVVAGMVARAFAQLGQPPRSGEPDVNTIPVAERWLIDVNRCLDSAVEAQAVGASVNDPVGFNTHGVLREGRPLQNPARLYEIRMFCAEMQGVAARHLHSLRSQRR